MICSKATAGAPSFGTADYRAWFPDWDDDQIGDFKPVSSSELQELLASQENANTDCGPRQPQQPRAQELAADHRPAVGASLQVCFEFGPQEPMRLNGWWQLILIQMLCALARLCSP